MNTFQLLTSLKGKSSFFPLTLMEMLGNDGFSDIVSWLPDGDAFAIHDKKRFATEVLPLLFKGSIQFSSFTRRMKRWKFTLGPTTLKSRSSVMYSHPLFKRNEVEKCIGMKPKPQLKSKKVSENKYFMTTETPQYTRENTADPTGSGADRHEQILHTQPVRHYQICTPSLTLEQQGIHHDDMQLHYLSSLSEIYATHQAHLKKQMELSRFTMTSMMMIYRDASI